MLRLVSSSQGILAVCHPVARRRGVVASLSSGAVPAPKEAEGCPFSGEADSATKETKLVKVPMLPYLGSIVTPHSGAPRFDPEKFYDFYPENRRRFGDFYRIGFPGLGQGRDGEMYVLTDPHEMQKVLRQEKGTHPYPRGIVETEWPLIRWLKEKGSPLGLGVDGGEADEDGFMGRGETWKRLRTFLQTDMLSPQAAKGYIPGMVEAAEFASKGAPASSSDLNAYTNRCSFDLFCSMMLGEMTKMADPNTGHSEENIEFCKAAVEGMNTMMLQISNPLQLILFRLGIRTSLYNEMVTAFDKTVDIAEKKYQAFRERYEAGDLTEEERNSYLYRAIERQAAEDSTVSESELSELIEISLTAAVDTTSSLVSWNMMHLAINPDVQEKLHAELVENLKGDRITADTIAAKNSPYLHAVIRESHRITPAVPAQILKENSLADVEVHGTVIPKDSLFALDSHSVGLDPNFVDDPYEFKPERWLPDAVEARKGSPAEILDHPFYRSPFSQGSRKCPGSRIASNEVLIMIAQLVLDWKMKAPANMTNFRDVPYKMSGMIHPVMPDLEFEARN